MGNETIEGKVRKFFKFVGIDQLIHKEQVNISRVLEILRGIDILSVLDGSASRFMYEEYDFSEFIRNPAAHLVDEGGDAIIGTYRQLLYKHPYTVGFDSWAEDRLEHNLKFDNDIWYADVNGKKFPIPLHLLRDMCIEKAGLVPPCLYTIRWQTKYETDNA